MRKHYNIVIFILIALFVSAASTCFSDTIMLNSPIGNKDSDKMETSIGDLYTDSMREALETNIAIATASEIKVLDPPIPVGKANVSDIIAAISYPGDNLSILSLSGKDIRKALEKSLSIYPQPNMGFLQVSGIKFNFDPKQKSGSRITSIMVGTLPLDNNTKYSVGVSCSLANGAVGYWKIWGKGSILKQSIDKTLSKVVQNYISDRQLIDYGKLERINLITKDNN